MSLVRIFQIQINDIGILWICTCLFFIPLKGQTTFTTEKQILSTPEGLEFGKITALEPDTLGMLWIMGYESRVHRHGFTKNKLRFQRFNGFNFFTITIDSLLADPVNPGVLQKDQSGNLISHALDANTNEKKIVIFNPYNFTCETFSMGNRGDEELIKGILVLDDGFAWITYAKNKFNTITSVDREFEGIVTDTFHIQPSITNSKRTQLVQAENLYQVLKYFGKREFVQQILSDTLIHFWQDKSIFTPVDYWGQNLLVMDDLTTFRYDTNRLQFVYEPIDSVLKSFLLPTSHFQSRSLIQQPEGMYLMYIYDSVSTVRTLTQTAGIQDYYMKRYPYPDVFYSENLSKGFFYGEDNQLIEVKFENNLISNYLREKSIRSILPLDNGDFIIASALNGLFLLHVSRQAESPILSSSDQRKLLGARYLLKDHSTYWTNSWSSIHTFNLSEGLLDNYPLPVEIQCVLPRDSLLYIGSLNDHLYRFNRSTHEIEKLTKVPGWQLDILMGSDQNDLFIASNKGLFNYNISTQRLKAIPLDQDNELDYILSLGRLDRDHVLAGTFDGRIFKINELTDSITPYYLDDLESPIADLTFDSINEVLWIATFKGLVQYDVKKQSVIKRYSIEDGLSNNECNRYSQKLLEDGTLVVGTIDGINFIKPQDDQSQSEFLYPLLSSAFFESEKNDKVQVIASSEKISKMQRRIVLSPFNRYLKLAFATNQLSHPITYRFEYKLNNLSWQAFEHNNQLELLDLAPGDHTLQVRALNSFNQNNEQKVYQLEVVVSQVFYKRWYFILLIVSLGLYVAYYLLRQANLEKKLQKQYSNDLLKAREAELKQLAREIHDSAGQSLTLLAQKSNLTNQSELKKLSQQALDELRNISHHMYPHALEQFGLSAALESLCNKIDRESSIFIDANIEVIEVELSLEKQLQIYRIAQEAITNTLKHAQASSIILIFHKQGNQLELNIKDNGRGFQKIAEKAANSFGLRSIYERTQLLGGNISIISAPGQGTNTILTVPII